jgi:hypothetical protein
MGRLSEFDGFDSFPRAKNDQRKAVQWLQGRTKTAFNRLNQPKSLNFLVRLFSGDRRVDCMLRIFDHLGIAAVDMVYTYAHLESTARLCVINEQGLGAKYDRVLRCVAPMHIAAMKQALAEEQQRENSERFKDVYDYAELIINRWSEVHSVSNSRTSPIDTWFVTNHQAVLWDYFDNRCAKCGSSPPQFRDRTIDHAFVPFSRGGTFIIRDETTNTWTLNAIPLCRTCNSAKGARAIESFFAAHELQDIEEKLRGYPL